MNQNDLTAVVGPRVEPFGKMPDVKVIVYPLKLADGTTRWKVSENIEYFRPMKDREDVPYFIAVIPGKEEPPCPT